MNTLLPPGVRYERVDVGPPRIASLRTDVAGFVGLAERGPVDVPTPVESFRQFQATFGAFLSTAYLAYSVRAFFENGGQRCYVVRVAAGATAASTSLGGLRIAASSPGAWGNRVRVEARELHRAETTILRSDDANSSRVASTAGLAPRSLVRIVQGTTELWRVVAKLEPVSGRVYWVHPDPAQRGALDQPLVGIDRAAPAGLQSYELGLLVWEGGALRKTYDGLSLVPGHPRFAPDVLASTLVDPVVATMEGDPGPLASLAASLTGGTDGLAGLTPSDYVGEPFSPLDDAFTRAAKARGLRTLESVDEVSILAVPDIHIQPQLPPTYAPLPPCPYEPCRGESPPDDAPPPDFDGNLPPIFSDDAVYVVQAAMVEQCERRRDRFAVLSAPFSTIKNPGLGLAPIRSWRNRFDTKYAALYYPWAVVADPLRDVGGPTRALPPCGHVVGQYAQTDLNVGVHKAPANAPLAWIQDLTAIVGPDDYAVLNDERIDLLVAAPGRGLRIGGARTLSSDSDWRFVNVRRLMSSVEKAIDASTQWAAFEPNDEVTRAKLRLALFSYLLGLFQAGALAGKTADASFFVRCDDTNNPPETRALGWLLAEVGVAPAQPFEFVVVRVGRVGGAFEVQGDAP